MPNECWNNLTITANKDELDKLVDTEFTEVPEWAIKITNRGNLAVRLSLWTAWRPDTEKLEKLIVKYPSCWIKNIWSEEGGLAGIWIGSTKNGEKFIQQLEWNDMSIEEECYRFRKDSVPTKDSGPG